MPKILLVDDEPHIRLLLEEALEELAELGVQLLFAVNGAQALEIIEKEKPELVFLDIMLPEVSGYDVCNKVKKELELPGIHIIMLTAKGQEFDKIRGLDCGADAYLTKPFNPVAVKQKAREVLGI